MKFLKDVLMHETLRKSGVEAEFVYSDDRGNEKQKGKGENARLLPYNAAGNGREVSTKMKGKDYGVLKPTLRSGHITMYALCSAQMLGFAMHFACPQSLCEIEGKEL